MFKKKDEEKVEEEILSIVEEGHEQGVIHEDEAMLITNVLDFDDKCARDIMTSRSRIFAIEQEELIKDALPKVLESQFSRCPVYDNEIDNITGVLHLKDLIAAYLKDPGKTVGSIKVNTMFIHPTYEISKLLKKMQKEKTHMAVVVDEYGQTDGLVTLEDILEELVGNILDEHDKEEYHFRKTADDGYVVDGMLSLNDLEELLPDTDFPDGEVETLNGFILYQLGRLPEDNEQIKVDYGGYIFKPIEIKDNMVRLVKIEKQK
ncbi:MAG: hemolysin family protein [Eubacterium sp.]|nr:hemolysin family protein [Eubacterium sp.]